LFGLSLLLASCSDDFLIDAAKPLDKAGGEGFYNSPGRVRSGLTGVYQELYSVYSRDNYEFYVNHSDNGQFQPELTNRISEFDKTVDNSAPGVWNDNFKMVSKSNVMIEAIEENLPDFESDETLAAYMGEAKFLRALAYFNLVVMYGDVPLLTTQLSDRDEILATKRTPKKTVFEELIIPDLEFAATHCYLKSELDEIGRLGAAPKGVAKLLLAEAYLFQDRHAEAEQVLEEVIASGEYALMSSHGDIWGNDNNKEVMFAIQYNFDATGETYDWTRLIPFTLQPPAQTIANPTSISVPTDDLVNSMIGDTRFQSTLDSGAISEFDSSYIDTNYWTKFIDSTQTTNIENSSWDKILFRYPDVLHLAAEAEIMQNKIGEAFTHLNETRVRAGMPPYDPAGLTQDQALDMYLQERRIEMAGEMKRWRDLIRTDKAKEVISAYLGTEVDEEQFVFPIPLNEIQANPGLEQNPGY